MEPMSWQAPNFHYQEKSSSWYLWSIGIAVGVALLSLFQGNILFVFFVVIAETLVLMLGKQQPRLVVYEVNETRVSADGYREYPYTELAGFAVVPDPFAPRYHELVLTPKKRLGTFIKILVPNERAEALKTYVGQYLNQIEYEESLSDNIIKRIGL